MSRTFVPSTDNQSDNNPASNVLMHLQEFQQRAIATSVSWEAEESDADERSMDDADADFCAKEDDADNVSLWYLWELLSSSVFASLVTAAGWVWHVELVALVISLPLELVADLGQYCNAWPPALTLLALLTVLAIILQPDGYTWIIVRHARDCILVALRESSTVWSILVNNFGTALSTIMAASVFFGLFFFIYVLHKTLSPRPKIHLQNYETTANLDHKHGKRRRKKAHVNKGGAKVNNRLQPRSKRANNLNIHESDHLRYATRELTQSTCDLHLQHQHQSLVDDTANQKTSSEMLPALLEDSQVNAPLRPSSFSSTDKSSSTRQASTFFPAKPSVSEAAAAAMSCSTSHSTLRTRTLSASSEATTASCSDSSFSNRSDITAEILAPPGFGKKGNCVAAWEESVGKSIHADAKVFTPSKASRAITATRPSFFMTSMGTPSGQALEPVPVASHSSMNAKAAMVDRSGPNDPRAARAPFGWSAPLTLNSQQSAARNPEENMTDQPLYQPQLVAAASPPLPSASCAPSTSVNCSPASSSDPQTPARSRTGASACQSPFDTPKNFDSSSFSPLVRAPTSNWDFNTASSLVWSNGDGIAVGSGPNRLNIPPPPGISVVPLSHAPSLDCPDASSGAAGTVGQPLSWAYGGLGANEVALPFHTAGKSLCDHRHEVNDNPFVTKCEDEDRIEAELEELGGRMVGCLLDF